MYAKQKDVCGCTRTQEHVGLLLDVDECQARAGTLGAPAELRTESRPQAEHWVDDRVLRWRSQIREQ